MQHKKTEWLETVVPPGRDLGRLSEAPENLVAGHSTANAPAADGGCVRGRLSRLQVAHAGDAKPGATPQVWVKGLRFKMVRKWRAGEIPCPAADAEAGIVKEDTYVGAYKYRL